MKTCDWTLERLDDFVDGELPRDDERDVALHLEDCDACRAEFDGLRSLLAEARALPKTVSPPRDLWPAVEARLDSNTVSFSAWRRRLATAAYAAGVAAAVVLAATLGFARIDAPTDLSEPEPVVANTLEFDRAALREAYVARVDTFDAEYRTVVETNLGIIEQSEAEIQLAMAENPDDQQLARMLQATQRSEVDLLRRALRRGLQNDTVS